MSLTKRQGNGCDKKGQCKTRRFKVGWFPFCSGTLPSTRSKRHSQWYTYFCSWFLHAPPSLLHSLSLSIFPCNQFLFESNRFSLIRRDIERMRDEMSFLLLAFCQFLHISQTWNLHVFLLFFLLPSDGGGTLLLLSLPLLVLLEDISCSLFAWWDDWQYRAFRLCGW